MVALILLFVAGLVLGIVGLRLLNYWEQHPHNERPTTFFRHHP